VLKFGKDERGPRIHPEITSVLHSLPIYRWVKYIETLAIR